MQRLILVFLAAFSFTSFNGYAGQARTSKPNRDEDRVIIQRHRIVGQNQKAIYRVHEEPDEKRLQEYREDAWLTEFSYAVNYNSNYLLDITFKQSGMAAYPDEQSRHFLINLKDAHIVKAHDAFESNKLDSLAALADRELQREIKRIANENRDPDGREAVDGAYDNLRFEVTNLDEFSVGPKGITFLYDAGFPHVIKALEPEGRYFFSYSILREYIKRDGPLGQFVD